MKPVLVSGIQPSGRLHIGNYLGALKNFVDLQNSGEYECYFFIADLHSITGAFDPKEKRQQILETTAEYLAGGLNQKKSVIFQQSRISAHCELMWILNTITSIGDLSRMTQFKDKTAREIMADHNRKPLLTLLDTEYLKEAALSGSYMGLFDYPVLMAADILLYSPVVVPVGDDQLQHLELTRTLARKFNKKFGKTFTEPKDLLTKTPRIMSLKDPSKKMSKSQPESCLFIDDSPEEIKAKIARATTDSGSEISYDPKKKPGLSNLIEIAAGLRGEHTDAVVKKFAGKNYGEFKKGLAELVTAHFASFREKKKELLANPKKLAELLTDGSKKAAKVADKKMAEVKEKVGLTL